ncbi:MAG TPA: tetratricopeptide repeat protein, partial [Phycisphaerae bacterium]|nr:tetratricopeptide repeat protein [Phycisphaerae bacterium]
MGAMSAEQALEIAADHHRSGRLGPARAIYEQVLQQLPDQPVALHLLGLVNAQEGQIDQAVLLIRRAIEAWPNDVNFHANLAQILKNAGKIDAAADAYQNALALAPERSDLHFGLGNVRRLQARIPEAMAEYHETLRLDPSHAPALNNLGNCLLNAGNPGEALELLRRAVELNPDDYLALASLGTALRQLGRNPEAIACFRRAITLHPGDPRLHVIAGDALRDEKCFADAAAGYRAALALDGDRVDVRLNLALSLWDSDQLDAALDVCRKLLERWPGHVPAWTNLALMLLDSGQITEAIASLSKAVDLDPADAELHGKLIYMKFFDPRTTPHSSRNDLAEWNRRHGVRETTTPYHVLPTPHRRLRIGYVSPDFRQHVVGRNILPLLRNHDHSAFEIFCYSSNRAHDLLTDEFRRLADYFHVIAGESDEQAAARICDDRIDILVDLAVHTSGNRLGIFARKPAPVQATFAGYPGSTGLATIDYRITDPYLDPPRSPGRDL